MNTDYINRMVTFEGLKDAMKQISSDIVKIGDANYVTGRRSIGWGNGNQVKGLDLITFGSLNRLMGADSVVLGSRNIITNNGAANLLVLGQNMQITAEDNNIGVAIGTTAKPSITIKKDGEVAIGTTAKPSITIKKDGEVDLSLQSQIGTFHYNDYLDNDILYNETTPIILTQPGLYLFEQLGETTYSNVSQTQIAFWTPGKRVYLSFETPSSIFENGIIKGSVDAPQMKCALLFALSDNNLE